MDAGRELSYEELAHEIWVKCSLILSSDNSRVLNSVGVTNLTASLLSVVANSKLKAATLQSKSKWKNVREAVQSMGKLNGLLRLKKKREESQEI